MNLQAMPEAFRKAGTCVAPSRGAPSWQLAVRTGDHDAMGGKGKKRFAVTVDELGGSASSRVDFIRTDARAAKRATPSNTHLKDTLSSPFDIARGLTGPASAAVIRQLVTLRTAAPEQPGVVIGLGAVTRRLQRGELRAVVMAGEMHPALLVAHIPVQAARAAVPLCILECSSAQLGQPFGLLRAAAIGFTSKSFELEHPLIRLLAESAAAPPPWLEAAATAAAAAVAAEAAAEAEAEAEEAEVEAEEAEEVKVVEAKAEEAEVEAEAGAEQVAQAGERTDVEGVSDTKI